MTEDIASLGLAVQSDQVATATDRNKRFEASAAGAERSAKGLEQTTGLLTRAMGLLGAALSVGQLIRMTSTWTDLNSRIRNAVGAHENAADVMKRIDEMARRTYSSLEQTAESYLRNATALTQLGYTTKQQLDLTESLNNALVISATKGQRAESVMNAWSKAMALGKLSGDNLNIIMESGDRLSEALADSMGVTVLELRKLGTEGKITGKEMFGLTSELEKLRAEAEAMPGTIEDGFIQIGRALTVAVGELDAYLGSSGAVAEGMVWLADNINILVPFVGALAAIIGTALVPALVSATLAMLAFAASPIGLTAIAIGALAAAFTHLWNEARLLEQTSRDLSASIGTNESALDAAKTSSTEYREELRAQITMQLAAADAALKEASAQLAAAEARGSLAGSVWSAVGDAFEGAGFGPNHGREQAGRLEEWVSSAARDRVTEIQGSITELRGQLAEIDQIMTTPPGTDDKPGARPTDPTKDQAKAAKAYDNLVAATERRTESLLAEAEALGLTGVQAQSLINLHELMADAEKTGVEMTEPRIEQLTRLSEALTDAQLTLEGLHIALDNQSPWEAMAEQVQNLNELMERGKITASDYWAEVGKSAEDMVGSYASAANGIIGQAEKLTDALGLQGKEAFEAEKAISLAKAVVSGGEAIVKSYNWGTTLGGPIGGAIAAGLAAAATAAQIGAIASTSYQSKSMPNAAGRGGGAVSAAAAPAAAPAPAQQSVNVTLVGQGGFSRDQVNGLIEQINDAVGDGAQIRVHAA